MPGLKNYSLLVAMAALHMSSNAECSVLRIRDEDDDTSSGSIIDMTNSFKANAAQKSGSPSPAPPAEKHSDDDGSGSSEQPKDSQAAAPANKASPSALSETQGGANGENQGA